MITYKKMSNCGDGNSYIYDMKVIGPGLWADIHLHAYNSHTNISKIEFIKSLRRKIDNIACSRCRVSALEYISNHRPEEYINNLYFSMFHWTYLFHNYVNVKLNKKVLTYEEALSIYEPKGNDVCVATTHTNTSKIKGVTYKRTKW